MVHYELKYAVWLLPLSVRVSIALLPRLASVSGVLHQERFLDHNLEQATIPNLKAGLVELTTNTPCVHSPVTHVTSTCLYPDLTLCCGHFFFWSLQVSGEKEFFAQMVVDAVSCLDPNTLDLKMIGIKKVSLHTHPLTTLPVHVLERQSQDGAQKQSVP